ncbi:hypothetical protein BGZ65_000330, partial [Modicella reniformis]
MRTGTPGSNDISSKTDMISSTNPAQMILEGLTPKEPGRLKSIPTFVLHKSHDDHEESGNLYSNKDVFRDSWALHFNKDAIANSIQDNSI